MGLFDRFLSRKKTSYNLNEIAKLVAHGEWNNQSQMDQYGKSLYVYAAISKIATKVASIDLVLREIINSKGEIKEHASHPVLDLLYRPNPFQTRTEFWKITIINKKLTGEAFWGKVRNGRKVVELWNLRPDVMTVITDEQNYIKRYELTKSNGEIVAFLPEDIIHFKDPNPTDPYRGISPLRSAQSRVETEQYANDFQRNFFLNNARPDALLLSEDTLAPEQREELRAGWESRHRGKNKSSRIGILEGGLSYQQVSVTQKEMDYIESLKFTRDDILVAFGVPKSVITTDDVNLANANSGLKTFLSETIKPEIAQLVEVINEMLVIPDYSERFYVDFEDPTPLDRQMQLQEFTAGVDKWITRNEIRESLNLEPIDGGDTLFAPQGGVAIDAPPTVSPITEDQAAAPEDPQKVFRGRSSLKRKLQMIEGMAADFAKSMKGRKRKSKETLLKGEEVRGQYESFINKKIDRRASRFQKDVLAESQRQLKRVLATLEKDIEVKDFKFDKAKENRIFTELALPFMKDAARESGEEAMSLIGVGEEFNYTAALEKRLKARAKFFATSVNDTTFEKLSRTLAEGIEAGEGIVELRERVSAVYTEFPTYRAEAIARTESTAVNNEGFLEAYSQSKVVNSMEWVATKDSRTREEHLDLDGEIVEVGHNFSNGLPYPQEPNCRCVLAPVI